MKLKGVNSDWMDDWEQNNEPGSPYTDPAPDPRGPAADPHYGRAGESAPGRPFYGPPAGNVNPTLAQSPEGLVASSYFTPRGIQVNPWQPVSPGSLLYRNSVTGAVQIRRGR